MVRKRPANARGHFDHGWLDTWHSFSFGHYQDPEHMGFRSLRVINDDVIQPGRGFGMHGHRDMEIVTYVLDGALAHEDNLGKGSVLRSGDVQRKSAGTGVMHSEYNHSADEAVRLLQIWLLPERDGITPGWEEKRFESQEKRGRLRLIVSPDGTEGSLRIHRDVRIYAAVLVDGESVTVDLDPARHAWVQVARGTVTVNDEELSAGDGAAISGENILQFTGARETEFLLFDLD